MDISVYPLGHALIVIATFYLAQALARHPSLPGDRPWRDYLTLS
jgi:hypothetical protein